MSKSNGLKRLAFVLVLGAVMAPLSLQAAGRTYFGLGYTTRAYSAGDTGVIYKMKSMQITAGKSFELSDGWNLTLDGGLALNNFNGLVLNELPVSLEIASGSMPGLVLGARLDTRLWTMEEFVVELETDVRASVSLKKSWDLEDFAVDGKAKGTNWMAEASIGPRISYRFFGSFVPSLKIAASFFTGRFKMDETLEDLEASQKATLKGKGYVEAVLGGLFRVSEKVSLNAEVGFRPYKGGIDPLLGVSALVNF